VIYQPLGEHCGNIRESGKPVIWIIQILITETIEVSIIRFCLSAFYRAALDNHQKSHFHALSESPYKNQYRRATETETIIEKRKIKRKEKKRMGEKKRERSLRYRSNATQVVCDNKLSASGITADCDGQVRRQKPTRMDY